MAVKVRLVPKSRSGGIQAFDLAMSSMLPREEIETDPDRARLALNKCMEHGYSARITNKDRVEMQLSPEEVKEYFKADVTEVSSGIKSDVSLGVELSEQFYKAETGLTIPEDMQDDIAFAYIPTPPTFFAVNAIPPKISLHYLSLDDVRGVSGAAKCHRRGWTGSDVRAVMVDSGFSQHPYFRERGFNYNPIVTPQQPDPFTDPSGHGTGESANLMMIAPNIEFHGVRFGGSAAEDLESALATGATILSNSWGWDADHQSWDDLRQTDPNLYFEFQDLSALIVDATADGKVIIFSAGNGHRAFPGSHPDVIAAGGVTVNEDSSLQASSYASSFESLLHPGRLVPDVCGVVGEATPGGPMPGHIMLPVPSGAGLEGENMPADKSDLGWGIFSGTSAAAPQIAGVVALMQHARATVGKAALSTSEVKAILQATAIDVTEGLSGLGDPADIGFDRATGAGFIDAFSACVAATNN